MGISQILHRVYPKSENSRSTSPARLDTHVEKSTTAIDDSPAPWLTWPAALLGVIAPMGSFIFGYATAQISGFMEMDDFKRRFSQYDEVNGYYFSHSRMGLIVGLLSVGTMAGCFFAAPIAERFGRRISFSFWCAIHIVGTIVEMTTTSKWYQVAIGRLVAGVGIGGLTTLVPMFQSECAPPSVRGFISSTFQLLNGLGMLTAYCVNYGTYGIQSTKSWRIPMGIGYAWALILGIGIYLIPESPRFLYRIGKVDLAQEVMAKYAGVPLNHRQVVREMNEMKEKQDEEKSTAAWYEVFTGPGMLWRTSIGITLQALQQLTGANFIFFYGNTVFTATGLSNSFITEIVMGTVNVATGILALWVVHHFRRRVLMIVGGVCTTICFLNFASIGHFVLDRENPQNTPRAGAAMIIFACLFIVSYGLSWGPVVWVICGELYPTRHRAVCVSLTTAANWTSNFLFCLFTPFLAGAIDFRYGYVFCGCCATGTIVTYFFVNETHGRTLEEVDTMYVTRVLPWKSKNWVPPRVLRGEPDEVAASDGHGEPSGSHNPTNSS